MQYNIQYNTVPIWDLGAKIFLLNHHAVQILYTRAHWGHDNNRARPISLPRVYLTAF